MTVQSTKSIIVHLATQGQDTYIYDFIILQDKHVYLYLDNIPYVGGFQVLGLGGQDGGTVVLDTPILPIDAGKQLAIVRTIPPTQELDYTAYDGFPPESHERGLDKLTMLVQQSTNALLNAIHIPATEDTIGINTMVPPVDIRANKALFFDNEGNVTVYDPDIDLPAVYRIDIQDGAISHDSRSLLTVETISGGVNYPKIGFTNVNGPNGPVQLNDQGNIPIDLINIIGIQIRGPFRGDDLCPKLGDESGFCTVPDRRNPSQRFLDIADRFDNGDMFIVIMGEGETEGTMNLIANIGEPTHSVVNVKSRDGIVYLKQLDNPDTGEILTYEGWYHLAGIVETGDASFIVYDDTGNYYITGTNVQVTIDAIDSQFKLRDDWVPTSRNAQRSGITAINANLINATGFYTLNAGSSNLPDASPFTITHIHHSTTEMTQVAVNRVTGSMHSRVNLNGTWTNWIDTGTGDGTIDHSLLVNRNAPNQHTVASISDIQSEYFKQDRFTAESVGAQDANKPVKLDHNGNISDTMLDYAFLDLQGEWTPDVGDEYPPTVDIQMGYTWIIGGVAEAGYTFASGDLIGWTTTNGDALIWSSRGWIGRDIDFDPGAFYRLDGTVGLTAPLAAATQRLSNIGNAIDDKDAVTFGVHKSGIATREPTLDNPAGNGHALVSTIGGTRSWTNLALQFHNRNEYINVSVGAPDANKPVLLDTNGVLSDSFINFSLLEFQGQWTPTNGNEYPDVEGLPFGAAWRIDGLGTDIGYIFLTGDIAGAELFDGDFLLYGRTTWAKINIKLNIEDYYRVDGSVGLTGPFAGGGQQIRNIANGTNNQDAAAIGQMNQRILRSGDTMAGQLSGIAPVAAANFTRRDWVESQIAATLFPPGTRMVFAQNAPPPGWSQDKSNNADDRMLRVVKYGGGGVSGVDSPIVNSKVSSHTHQFTGSATNEAGEHKHGIPSGYNAHNNCNGTHYAYASHVACGTVEDMTSAQGRHSHTVSGTIDPNTGSSNWAPRYINLVIGVKS